MLPPWKCSRELTGRRFHIDVFYIKSKNVGSVNIHTPTFIIEPIFRYKCYEITSINKIIHKIIILYIVNSLELL